jgi:3'(2'), 5'-bisphosphate nucleotidase
MFDRQWVLAKLLDVAAAASEVVMRIYGEGNFGVEMKGPKNPVTRADKSSNALLLDLLGRDFPKVPIVSEESSPATYEGFDKAPCAFFVDPLDGTMDFVARTGEFAVMIGFVEDGRPTVGVVHCPALGEVYGAVDGGGAFRMTKGERRPIHVGNATDLSACRGAISRFHRDEAVDARVALLGLRELVPMGSAGIKGVRVASGELDVYSHPVKSIMKPWDTCAPEAIVRAAGGIYTDGSGRSFNYLGRSTGEGTLAANPILHAEALRRLRGEAESRRSVHEP